MVTDTEPLEKTCSRCGGKKECAKFIKNRNICKECCNIRKKEKYVAALAENTETSQTCTTCNQTKLISCFITNRPTCKDCNNAKRKIKYQTDEAHRLNVIKQASEFKHNKVLERQQIKLEEIGEGNKKCSKCSTIKLECNFRHNRLKCKICERDEPLEKLKRSVRGRIWSALKNKSKHTIAYLGMNSTEYLEWILTYNENYTIDNRGTEWHIDHVIPLSRFDLDDEDEQLIAFNWRNTMPLSAKENLVKHTNIIPAQIEQHLKFLLEYHKKQNTEMPQKFIDLFAKHLVDGNPLKQSLPLISGNLYEELG